MKTKQIECYINGHYAYTTAKFLNLKQAEKSLFALGYAYK